MYTQFDYHFSIDDIGLYLEFFKLILENQKKKKKKNGKISNETVAETETQNGTQMLHVVKIYF